MFDSNLFRYVVALGICAVFGGCSGSSDTNSNESSMGGMDVPASVAGQAAPASSQDMPGRGGTTTQTPSVGTMTSATPASGGSTEASAGSASAGSSGDTEPMTGGLPTQGGQPSSDEIGHEDGVFVKMTTRLGSVTMRLLIDQSPIGCANFLQYVDDGFYDGQDGLGATTFHRVISGFMAQGGGILMGGERKMTRAPIRNESDNGLKNLRGTVAYARTADPNSATSQFFINLVDNPFLDNAPNQVGYAVFGEVIEGMEAVDAMAREATDANDVPMNTITIERMERTRPD